MEILESLIDILEACSTDDAMERIQKVIDEHRLEPEFMRDILGLDDMNGLIQEQLDNDSSYGWINAIELFNNLKCTSDQWYYLSDYGVMNLTDDDISNFVSQLANKLKDELIDETSSLCAGIAGSFKNLYDYYYDEDQEDTADEVFELGEKLEASYDHDLSELIQTCEKMLEQTPSSAFSTQELTSIRETIQQLKRYQDFL